MTTTLTPVKGKGGVVRYVAAPPAALEERDRAIAALQVEVLRGRAANTHLQDQLAKSHEVVHNLKSEVRGLRAALSSSLSGPTGTRWRATICDDCGCLTKPHEACPMCLWTNAQQSGAFVRIDPTSGPTKTAPETVVEHRPGASSTAPLIRPGGTMTDHQSTQNAAPTIRAVS